MAVPRHPYWPRPPTWTSLSSSPFGEAVRSTMPVSLGEETLLLSSFFFGSPDSGSCHEVDFSEHLCLRLGIMCLYHFQHEVLGRAQCGQPSKSGLQYSSVSNPTDVLSSVINFELGREGNYHNTKSFSPMGKCIASIELFIILLRLSVQFPECRLDVLFLKLFLTTRRSKKYILLRDLVHVQKTEIFINLYVY